MTRQNIPALRLLQNNKFEVHEEPICLMQVESEILCIEKQCFVISHISSKCVKFFRKLYLIFNEINLFLSNAVILLNECKTRFVTSHFNAYTLQSCSLYIYLLFYAINHTKRLSRMPQL